MKDKMELIEQMLTKCMTEWFQVIARTGSQMEIIP